MRTSLLTVVVVVLASSMVFAQQAAQSKPATNALSAGFPNSIIDTQTLPATKGEFGLSGGYVTGDTTFETAALVLKYGIVNELQFAASWPLVLGEGRVDGNGDTVLALKWAAVKDEGRMPALGLELSGKFPTGYGFTGYDGTLTGILTKNFSGLRFLANAGYTTVGDNDCDGKDHTDSFKIGADYLVVDDVDVILDLFSNMAPVDGGDRIEGVELGTRWAVTDVDMLSAGIAVGLGNGNITPDFAATLAYQRAL